tara:strand:- start:3404 stop:4306 length:903 start_codon:yes stop_codon:yes gene_type:complete
MSVEKNFLTTYNNITSQQRNLDDYTAVLRTFPAFDDPPSDEAAEQQAQEAVVQRRRDFLRATLGEHATAGETLDITDNVQMTEMLLQLSGDQGGQADNFELATAVLLSVQGMSRQRIATIMKFHFDDVEQLLDGFIERVQGSLAELFPVRQIRSNGVAEREDEVGIQTQEHHINSAPPRQGARSSRSLLPEAPVSYLNPVPVPTTQDADWRYRASCRDQDPELFYPDKENKDTTAAAKRICRHCVVIPECLREEFSQGVKGQNGVRGGYSTRERRAILRRGANEVAKVLHHEERRRAQRL